MPLGEILAGIGVLVAIGLFVLAFRSLPEEPAIPKSPRQPDWAEAIAAEIVKHRYDVAIHVITAMMGRPQK